MARIPGGAFFRADASKQAYDGTRFAADGIVVVMVNYATSSLVADPAKATRSLWKDIAI